jgi:hypothetical protein
MVAGKHAGEWDYDSTGILSMPFSVPGLVVFWMGLRFLTQMD